MVAAALSAYSRGNLELHYELRGVVMVYRILITIFCVLLSLSPLFAQALPAQSGARLAPLVRNFIETAIPTSAQLSARVWAGHPADWRPTRSEFEKAYEAARLDFRGDALIQLQPISGLAKQLNALNTLVNCAYEANRKIRDTVKFLTPSVSWPEAS